ncbi:MAG: hypothetical protein CMP68_04365 [Flavobacteriales bacterium]|nr:hypothetical protein [Flavobacteriales bacterium]|tara:strand:- start:1584 stop:1991 length:408 start_codon:yes stop_codon:yes gene_type:complete
MKHLKYIVYLFLIFISSSCDKEKEEKIKPNIIVENPSNDYYLIGESIPVSITINHEENIDNITYYEILNCSDDKFDSFNLLEWKNVYETNWSYSKTIETNKMSENIACSCRIQIEATALNNTESKIDVNFEISVL